METQNNAAASANAPVKQLSLADLDLVKASEKPFRLEVLSPKTDKPFGLVLDILGDHSDKVKRVVYRELNARRQAAALRQRKNQTDVELIEDDEAFAIESCVIRTVGWNLVEPFSADAVRQLYTQHPALRTQVLAASGNAGNFINL